MVPPSGGCVRSEVSERFPGARQVAFALVQVKGPGGCCMRVAGPAGRREDMSEIEQGVGMLAEQVGLRGEFCRRAREWLCFAGVAAVGEDPGRQSLADGTGGQVVVRRGFLAYRDQVGGFVVPAWVLGCDGSGQ